MADNIKVLPSNDGLAVDVATDEISNLHYPIYKQAFGNLDEALLVSNDNPLPIKIHTQTNNLAVNASWSNQYLGTTPLAKDAWGRQKVIHDYSLFHALFTHGVSDRVWEENSMDASDSYTPLNQTGTNAMSVLGSLKITSGATANTGTALISKRHPRYQPNRGHLYSTAGWFPNPEYNGVRRFGLFCGCLSDTRRSGVYFEIEGDGTNYTVYAVLKSYGVRKVRQDITALLPSGFDVSKNNLYDIQYQWRGAGNYLFYCDQQLVYTIEMIGKYQDLTIWNPALSVGFECVTHGTDNLEMRFGCVDVTSEGGARDSRQFASISTGTSLVSTTTTGTAVLAIKVPRTIIYNTVEVVNTRDVIASKLTSWTKDEASVQVYFARDTLVPNLVAETWSVLPDSTCEYLVGGTTSNLDNAFQLDKANMQLVLNEWDDLEKKNVIINPDNQGSPFYITSGDVMVVVVQPIGANKDNATTLYLSEEL